MDISDNQQSLSTETAKHLLKIGKYLTTICPPASKYYLFNMKQHLNNNLLKNVNKSEKMCEFCGVLWTKENHTVRIQPFPKKNNFIKKLLTLENNQPWKLNNRQKKKLAKFREATNKIVYTCMSCKKTLKVAGLKKKIPVSKKKRNFYNIQTKKLKSDLNAGLFLTKNKLIEKIQDTEEKASLSNSPVDSNQCSTTNCITNSTEPEKTVLTLENKTQFKQKNTFPGPISASAEVKPTVKNSLLHGNSSKSKKKKSLLAKILKQEENHKKNLTLSNFYLTLRWFLSIDTMNYS